MKRANVNKLRFLGRDSSLWTAGPDSQLLLPAIFGY